MLRLFRLSILLAFFSFLTVSEGFAVQTEVKLSGRIAPDEVRVLVNDPDTMYIVDREWVIAGTLIIEPGTDIYMYPQGRIVNSVGGRIIADGFANATYNKYPDGYDPIGIPSINPKNWDNFSDMDYFLYESKISTEKTFNIQTPRDLTVNKRKYNYIYNVVLDTMERRVYNLENPELQEYKDSLIAAQDRNEIVANFRRYPGEPSNTSNHKFIVPFEYAIMLTNSRMVGPDYKYDANLNLKPWLRVGDRSVDILNKKIRFIGVAVLTHSRDWGHIVVLPGSRATFFRNVSFEYFHKDTTVDRIRMYEPEFMAPYLSETELSNLNKQMRMLTYGSGGAITTFSSRTWLLNCEFKNNFARYRGGALQILQAPKGFPVDPNYNVREYAGLYPVDKNPNITECTAEPSYVNRDNPIIRTDNIDESFDEPVFQTGKFSPQMSFDFSRQAYDDGRLAVYLGRMRNLKFENNKAQIAKVDHKIINGVPIVMEITDEPAEYPHEFGNGAFGGAIYISGREGDALLPEMEIGFGVNNSIKTDDGILAFPNKDYFEALSNETYNYQDDPNSHGSRGGAIYVDKYTSLILAGKFNFNKTNAKYWEGALVGVTSAYYSMGGAVFAGNTMGRIQIRGGKDREEFTRIYTDDNSVLQTETITNTTEFVKNSSASGGAIFVDGNVDSRVSPVIGGSNTILAARDYGFNIKFEENQAIARGGAIFGKRNMTIYGDGGVEANSWIGTGYGGKNPVRFLKNTAGYSGGALDIRVPNSINPRTPELKRSVEIVRALFRENEVGYNVDNSNRKDIRGGGAIYCLHADLNLVKATEFVANKVKNGNGGAISLVNPFRSEKHFFVTDLDHVGYNQTTGIPDYYVSENACFIFDTVTAAYPPHTGMLTQFLDNEIEVEQEVMESKIFGNGTGTTQVGQGTLVTSNDLKGIKLIDEYTGFAVGQHGTLIKFNFKKDGTKWTYLNQDPAENLNKVFFSTAKNGIAVGEQGLIIRTTDGGSSWNNVACPTVNSLKFVTFSGTNVGCIVGAAGTILRTVDGGATWTLQTPNVTSNLYSAYFTSDLVGYVIGDRGIILKTTDGGANWNTLVSNTQNDLKGVKFTDMNTGYIVGSNGVILKTTNGGQSWDAQTAGTNWNLNSIEFTTTNSGYIVGDFGILLNTVNGGTNWTKQDPNTNYSLLDVSFATKDSGYAVGYYGTIIRTTDAGNVWTALRPNDEAIIDVVRYHQEIGIPENGVGLGGAIYLLDSMVANRINRKDSVIFNRVRFQNNKAYTGAAIYSDNFDLKLIFNRSLVTGNEAYSEIGTQQNVITGPVWKDGSGNILFNKASHDLVGAIIYGEIQGPLPAYTAPEAGNSFYDNKARFLIRLPDAPNTKGVLAGVSGIGYGGTDTLRGNYWGKTEANVYFALDNVKPGSGAQAQFETFFIDTASQKYLDFDYTNVNNDTLKQGPFESIWRINYKLIPLRNGVDENTVGTNSIPEKMVFSSKIYDMYDKGTDIKTADYTKRRLSPIEDFAVGIAPKIRTFTEVNQPSYGKYVKRWIRDPFIADSVDGNGDFVYPIIHALQGEFQPMPTKINNQNQYYHPIGYPLFLEAQADYTGLEEISNMDYRSLNETVYFVINETTLDYIRVNLRQFTDDAPYRETFRARVELVPDSSELGLRKRQTSMRRTLEGLMNLGTAATLLENLRLNPYKEDGATLQGRRYSAPSNQLGNVPTLFKNRPSLPASNEVSGVNMVTYFAGEKYRALPVNVGDSIRVISRTVLWRDGVIKAYENGIKFGISGSTQPPVFTGDVVKLQTDTIFKESPSEFPWAQKYALYNKDTITDLLHKVFVSEDREYPKSDGWYSNPNDPNLNSDPDMIGRDSILSLTAIDTNHFYDPRALMNGDNFSYLTYSWGVANGTGVERWLQVDTINANNNRVVNPKDGAKGYFMFRGMPTNPYVVPGGEEVWVRAANYPPHYRTIDSLKKSNMTQDQIDKFIYLFCPYLHASLYDLGENSTRARYLQQDTIDLGGNNYMTEAYKFRMYVVDSVPQFIRHDQTIPSKIRRVNSDPNGPTEEWVVYEPTVHTCGFTSNGKLKANLAGEGSTYKLRFMTDFNTDDEMEDLWATKFDNNKDHGRNYGVWDFRYGKTTYGFLNTGVRITDANGDTVVIDTGMIKNEFPVTWWDTLLVQTRPSWMANQYIKKYGDDNTVDALVEDFQGKGQINIRVDGLEAEQLLTSGKATNGAMNTDTLFTVVVNDGHGGVNTESMRIFINVAPKILNESLPEAVEDTDYNPQLIDSLRMIRVYDPNFGQKHTFELIYSGDSRNDIPRDPCFNEAGSWDISSMKTTPNWLHINQESGILYGTPKVLDAPKDELVTVLVTDEDGLTRVKQLSLTVKPVNHNPHLVEAPSVKCVDLGQAYIDTVWVVDRDLLRVYDKESLKIQVIEPTGIKVKMKGDDNSKLADPYTLSGTLEKDSVQMVIATDAFSGVIQSDGKVLVKVKVTDKAGVESLLTFKVKVTDAMDYVRVVKVENALGGYQYLIYGLADPLKSSVGDASDNKEAGKLDSNYCEYELPPLPNKDVFDARWFIPRRNGTLRNIVPNNIEVAFKSTLQAGGVNGNTSAAYPITIKVLPENSYPIDADIMSKDPTDKKWYIRDLQSVGNIFSFDMATAQGSKVPGVSAKIDNDTLIITVTSPEIDGFVILYDYFNDVNEGPVAGLSLENEVVSVTPNPVSNVNTANVTFSLNKADNVKLEIVDALGKLVTTLRNERFEANTHTVSWNCKDNNGYEVSSGSYLVRMTIGGIVSTYPFVIVK